MNDKLYLPACAKFVHRVWLTVNEKHTKSGGKNAMSTLLLLHISSSQPSTQSFTCRIWVSLAFKSDALAYVLNACKWMDAPDTLHHGVDMDIMVPSSTAYLEERKVESWRGWQLLANWSNTNTRKQKNTCEAACSCSFPLWISGNKKMRTALWYPVSI